MSKRLLITGASGFIGRNLAEDLAHRYEVFAPNRAELDLLDETAVRTYLGDHRFDVVLHAATGRSNRAATAPDLFKNNCRMFFNFARNRNLFGRLLHFGSGAEFDRRGYRPRMPESYFDTHVPIDDYGFAKYIAAQYTESTPGIHNLRLFGVFGKYEAWDVRFLSNACCRVIHDLPITIRQNVCFDYLDVADLAPLTAWFIDNEPSQATYNVCRGESRDLLSLARIVSEVSGCHPEIQVAREGFGVEYSGDNTRMVSEIGGFLFTPIHDSIQRLYAWYESHKAEIDPERLRFDG